MSKKGELKIGKKVYKFDEKITTGLFQEVCGILTKIDDKTRRGRQYSVGEMTGLCATEGVLIPLVCSLLNVKEKEAQTIPFDDIVEFVNNFFIKNGFMLIVMGILSTTEEIAEITEEMKETLSQNSKEPEVDTTTQEKKPVLNPSVK